jgi:peptide/nickel transport system permease protein
VATRQPVSEALLQRLPVTAELTILSIGIAVALALPLGILAAVKRNSPWDLTAGAISVLGLAVPNFWLAILLVLVFAVHLRWLPASGYVSFLDDPIGCLRSLLLPALALGGSAAAGLMRQIRSSMLEVLSEDYVRTARAKGLHERIVLARHALRNALIPSVTVLGVLFGRLMGGSLIVESIFLVPGVGSLLVNAIFTRDFPIVQAGALALALIAILSNLVVDMLYGYLDPRISQQ